jgi:hypothetical protein
MSRLKVAPKERTLLLELREEMVLIINGALDVLA